MLNNSLWSFNEKLFTINSLSKFWSSNSLLFIKVKPKPTSLDIAKWFISSGLYENSFIKWLCIGEITETFILRFWPKISTRFLCWLFLPDKNILAFLFKLFSFKKVLNDSCVSLIKIFKSSFDKEWYFSAFFCLLNFLFFSILTSFIFLISSMVG